MGKIVLDHAYLAYEALLLEEWCRVGEGVVGEGRRGGKWATSWVGTAHYKYIMSLNENGLNSASWVVVDNHNKIS